MTGTVWERLEDVPHVRDTVRAAASAARELVVGGPARADAASGADGGAGAASASGFGTDSAMTHSWVITGAPGSGRVEVARAFAAALECTDPDEPGCGRCRACRDALSGTHTDVVEFSPSGLSIGVDLVREEIVGRADTLPTVGRWRVIIMDNADRLTDQAANALLKTVEEPSPRTVLFFCVPSADPEDFSVTLRSRCRQLYVPPPSTDRLVRLLVEEEGATESDARLAAAASLRHVGRARRLVRYPSMQRRRAQALRLSELVNHGDAAFREGGSLLRSIRTEVDELYADTDAEERAALERSLGVGGKGKGVMKSLRGSRGAVTDLEKSQKARRKRRERDLLDLSLVDLSALYRDALLHTVGSTVEAVHPDFAPLAAELAGQVGQAGLVDCLDAIATCRQQLSGNVSPAIALDGLIGRLRLAYRVH